MKSNCYGKVARVNKIVDLAAQLALSDLADRRLEYLVSEFIRCYPFSAPTIVHPIDIALWDHPYFSVVFCNCNRIPAVLVDQQKHMLRTPAGKARARRRESCRKSKST